MRNATPWDVLGLEADASDADLHVAYRRRARETHPDHGGSNEAFARVHQAFEALRNRPANRPSAGPSTHSRTVSVGTWRGWLGQPGATELDARFGALGRVGAAAEQKVAARLNAMDLGPDTYLLHDLSPFSDSEANLDHVVVSGRDVVVLDTKCWAPGRYVTDEDGSTYRDLGHGLQRFDAGDLTSLTWMCGKLVDDLPGDVSVSAVLVVVASSSGRHLDLTDYRPAGVEVVTEHALHDHLPRSTTPAAPLVLDQLGRSVRNPSSGNPAHLGGGDRRTPATPELFDRLAGPFLTSFLSGRKLSSLAAVLAGVAVLLGLIGRDVRGVGFVAAATALAAVAVLTAAVRRLAPPLVNRLAVRLEGGRTALLENSWGVVLASLVLVPLTVTTVYLLLMAFGDAAGTNTGAGLGHPSQLLAGAARWSGCLTLAAGVVLRRRSRRGGDLDPRTAVTVVFARVLAGVAGTREVFAARALLRSEPTVAAALAGARRGTDTSMLRDLAGRPSPSTDAAAPAVRTPSLVVGLLVGVLSYLLSVLTVVAVLGLVGLVAGLLTLLFKALFAVALALGLTLAVFRR